MKARQKLKEIERPEGNYFMDENIQGLSDIEVPQTDDDMDSFNIDEIQGFSDTSDDDEIPDINTPPSERVSIDSN